MGAVFLLPEIYYIGGDMCRKNLFLCHFGLGCKFPWFDFRNHVTEKYKRPVRFSAKIRTSQLVPSQHSSGRLYLTSVQASLQTPLQGYQTSVKASIHQLSSVPIFQTHGRLRRQAVFQASATIVVWFYCHSIWSALRYLVILKVPIRIAVGIPAKQFVAATSEFLSFPRAQPALRRWEKATCLCRSFCLQVCLEEKLPHWRRIANQP